MHRFVLWVGALVALSSADVALAVSTCELKAKTNGDQTVPEAVVVNGVRTPTVVTLNGQPSQPQDITYSWAQRADDAFKVTFDNATIVKPSFTAPDVGPSGTTLHFTLTITGCGGQTDFTEVLVNVTNVGANRPPVAAITASATDVNEGDTFTLDGGASTDPDGDALSYSWAQVLNNVAQPPFSSAKSVMLTAPQVPYPNGASLVFRLTVSDGSLTNNAEKTIHVVWVNDPPVARVACDSSVNEGASVLLDGAASSDSDDGIASYSWKQLAGGPDAGLPGSALSLDAFSFTAPALSSWDAVGYDTMKFQLTVTDKSGVSSSAECSVQVLDVTGPVLTVPQDITKDAKSAQGSDVSFTVTAHDAVEGDVAFACSPPSGSVFPLGTTTVDCSAADSKGNTAQASFKITVKDMTPPVVTVPADMTVAAVDANGATATFTVTVTDNVDTGLTASCSPKKSGDLFPLGTTEVTCSAKDAAGNVGSAKFNVTVKDMTPPVVTVPADMTVPAVDANGATATFTVTVTDNVDTGLAASCTPKQSGDLFPLGTTEVTCSATDAAGNTGSAKFNVTVKDMTAPQLSLPSNVSADATSSNGAVVTYTAPTATDNVDGAVTPFCSKNPGDQFPLGVTTVSCTATDKAGNPATGTFKVTVQYAFAGFKPPITLDGRAAFKMGSTIPVKFSLGGASASISNATAKLYISQKSYEAVGDQLQEGSTMVGDGGNLFRSDGTGSYIFNWSTRGLATGTWWIYVDLGDGALHSVQLSTR